MGTTVANAKRHIFLTGPPGIGKTTLVQKVCNLLQNAGISSSGFFTEELRSGGTRVGFDVVTLDGKRGTLARLLQASSREESHHVVGQYGVTLKSFESFALPVFSTQAHMGGILVLDEIGRMELMSDRFKQEVKKAFSNPSITILATIPVKPAPFTKSLSQSPNTLVLVVAKSNRDNLVDQVFDMLTKT
ncbi:cancer-related nucleoside-triphosphatase homolog isoform X2 [Zootermopsis nevadensis]|uniref:cancer-related nucleoside-triphosphatase homolog isoform X2 n=1 Tax=Zootermopsis nevadensis TaxID=136037 RepID=UPI000B8E5D87|nr:cancer-related nucleoside-triphosphatase homolog isoform X2 [Zootermopsis nevadensis]